MNKKWQSVNRKWQMLNPISKMPIVISKELKFNFKMKIANIKC